MLTNINATLLIGSSNTPSFVSAASPIQLQRLPLTNDALVLIMNFVGDEIITASQVSKQFREVSQNNVVLLSHIRSKVHHLSKNIFNFPDALHNAAEKFLSGDSIHSQGYIPFKLEWLQGHANSNSLEQFYLAELYINTHPEALEGFKNHCIEECSKDAAITQAFITETAKDFLSKAEEYLDQCNGSLLKWAVLKGEVPLGLIKELSLQALLKWSLQKNDLKFIVYILTHDPRSRKCQKAIVESVKRALDNNELETFEKLRDYLSCDQWWLFMHDLTNKKDVITLQKIPQDLQVVPGVSTSETVKVWNSIAPNGKEDLIYFPF